MRRFVGFAVSVLLGAVALTVAPASAGAAEAASSSRLEHSRPQHSAGHSRLRVTKNKKGVEPGFAAERITAHPGRQAHGKVRFVLKGHGVKQARRVRISHGRAVFAVPPLGSGTYHVRVSYRDLRGATSFRVYTSAVRLDATSFTVSESSYDTQYAAQLRGDVAFEDGRPKDGYLDVYRDGDTAGGRSSSSFVGFTGIATDGTFDYTAFGQDVANHYPPGTYAFQAFYTPTPSFAYYVASAYVTVTVTA